MKNAITTKTFQITLARPSQEILGDVPSTFEVQAPAHPTYPLDATAELRDAVAAVFAGWNLDHLRGEDVAIGYRATVDGEPVEEGRTFLAIILRPKFGPVFKPETKADRDRARIRADLAWEFAEDDRRRAESDRRWVESTAPKWGTL